MREFPPHTFTHLCSKHHVVVFTKNIFSEEEEKLGNGVMAIAAAGVLRKKRVDEGGKRGDDHNSSTTHLDASIMAMVVISSRCADAWPREFSHLYFIQSALSWV